MSRPALRAAALEAEHEAVVGHYFPAVLTEHNRTILVERQFESPVQAAGDGRKTVHLA